jgi:8-amino-7-oxononanoate synthase
VNDFLKQKISKRVEAGNYRQIRQPGQLGQPTQNDRLIDFSSNDYLGFAKSKELYSLMKQYEEQYFDMVFPGAGASRLISGNHELYNIAEKQLSEFYKSEKALIFNSGYDANLGLISSICDRNDAILYDEYVHASIRDGIRLSTARSFSFRHDDIESLKEKIAYVMKSRGKKPRGKIVVVIETVYSMEGISKHTSGRYIFEDIIDHCFENGMYIIVDEAHSTGVYGDYGEGLVIGRNLQNKVFARVHTFGKALGVHGAVVVGSSILYDYLVNFARSFIYTTALPPHSLISILSAHDFLRNQQGSSMRSKLKENISRFSKIFYQKQNDVGNDSAIHSMIIPGNENAKKLAGQCVIAGFDVRAILSPTVPAGKERLRICLHSFNTEKEIDVLLNVIAGHHW